MTNSSRELGSRVVRGLARVGLVWAVAVLAVVFMGMSAQGQYGGGAAPPSAPAGEVSAGPMSDSRAASQDEPRAAGVALALVLLGVGGTILAVGAVRDERAVRRRYALQSDPAAQLPLAFGLSELA